ncbi:hypothetical protein HBI27_215190 [Parastagonospora nodorum]|nr:hypothetical protein HBI27_215190 [Parastagonospora nodorum]
MSKLLWILAHIWWQFMSRYYGPLVLWSFSGKGDWQGRKASHRFCDARYHEWKFGCRCDEVDFVLALERGPDFVLYLSHYLGIFQKPK